MDEVRLLNALIACVGLISYPIALWRHRSGERPVDVLVGMTSTALFLVVAAVASVRRYVQDIPADWVTNLLTFAIVFGSTALFLTAFRTASEPSCRRSTPTSRSDRRP